MQTKNAMKLVSVAHMLKIHISNNTFEKHITAQVMLRLFITIYSSVSLYGIPTKDDFKSK